MAVNRINDDILSRKTNNERVHQATSGKKEKLGELIPEKNKASLTEVIEFSEDAKKLQETEVILQNALQKLNEMDDIQHSNLAEFSEKIAQDFYDLDDVHETIVDELFSEDELRDVIAKRMVAEKYVGELKKLDAEDAINEAKLEQIRERIAQGYYNSAEVAGKVADELIDILDV